MGNRVGYLSLEEELQMMIDMDEILNFALVMVDVNNLKIVNDTFGHKAGDLLIQNASKIIPVWRYMIKRLTIR